MRPSVCIGAESVVSICVVKVLTEGFIFGTARCLKNESIEKYDRLCSSTTMYCV